MINSQKCVKPYHEKNDTANWANKNEIRPKIVNQNEKHSQNFLGLSTAIRFQIIMIIEPGHYTFRATLASLI